MDAKPPIKIYLAGPDVFYPSPLEQGRILKEHCTRLGAIGLFPMDNVLSPHPPEDLPHRIREANMAMIRSCDAVVANMEPFRGPSMDVGTAYEMGAAAALGKVVVGYSHDGRLYVERCVEFGGGLADENMEEVVGESTKERMRRHEDGTLRDANLMAVEEFVSAPLIDNLMLSCGLDGLCTTAEEAIQAAVEVFWKKNSKADVGSSRK